MSFKAQKWAWDQDTKSPLTQLLLFTIAHLEHDEKGYAWASHQYLADKCKCKRRALIDNLQYLEDEGYIAIERRTRDGMKQTNLYRCNYARNVATTDVQQMHKGSAADAQGGSAADAHKQITSFNRLINNNGQNEFDRFWEQFPKKVYKKDSLKAWNTACKKKTFDPEVLIADVIHRNSNDPVFMGDKQFIPNAAKYIRGEHWENEIIEKPKAELTEADKYGLSKQRTKSIISKFNANNVGSYDEALPPTMDEDEWIDWERGIPRLGN